MSRSTSKDKSGIYITLQQTNTNETISGDIPCDIELSVNEIVSDISNYDIYVKSVTVSSGNIPYFNIFKNIIQGSVDTPDINFELCRTNFSISIVNNTITQQFNNPSADDGLLIAINEGADNCDGITSFLQYRSDNTYGFPLPPSDGVPNGFNCQNFPLAYFDVHNIQTFVDMVNIALINIWTQNEFNGGITEGDQPILTFDPTTQLYSFIITENFWNKGYQIYVNGFLARALQGFRWNYIQDSNVNSPTYNGLDNLLIYPLLPIIPPGSEQFVMTAEYSTITNIVDIHSLVLLTTGGSDLTNIEPQYIPFIELSNSNLPTTQALIAFNLDFAGLNSSANNPYIQYSALVLDNKLTCPTKTSLRNLGLTAAVQRTDQTLVPISLQANGGLFSVTLVLFKKDDSK
jgi:hypothetical protein